MVFDEAIIYTEWWGIHIHWTMNSRANKKCSLKSHKPLCSSFTSVSSSAAKQPGPENILLYHILANTSTTKSMFWHPPCTHPEKKGKKHTSKPLSLSLSFWGWGLGQRSSFYCISKVLEEKSQTAWISLVILYSQDLAFLHFKDLWDTKIKITIFTFGLMPFLARYYHCRSIAV